MFSSFVSRIFLLGILAVPIFAGNEKNYTYLALGDSVAFGLDLTLTPPAPERYVGYPEILAEQWRLMQPKKAVNASCPGEASGSFFSSTAPDYHCRDFRAAVGLHTDYTGMTQGDFAISELLSNRFISLVTLGIGANDLILLQQACLASPSPYPDFPTCMQQRLIGEVLPGYKANLAQILSRIRAVYSGALVLVTYYSPTTNPFDIQIVAMLNQVMVEVGMQFSVNIADAFTAFQFASTSFGGDPCRAGLLVRLSPTTCDVHASRLGQGLIAATVALVASGDGSGSGKPKHAFAGQP